VAASIQGRSDVQDAASQDGLQQWLRTAVVIAYNLRLLVQLFSRNTADLVRSPKGMCKPMWV
jgi:hypothetical protein